MSVVLKKPWIALAVLLLAGGIALGLTGCKPEELGGAHTTTDDSRLARTINTAIVESRLLALEYYKENEDEFTKRTIEPYGLMNGPEGWYVHAFDTGRDAPRDFRLDRIKSADISKEKFAAREGMEPDVSGWPST